MEDQITTNYNGSAEANGKLAKEIRKEPTGSDIYQGKKNLTFGQAFEAVKRGAAMRLPSWQPDVLIKAQYPDEHSKMTAPYLYVESRFGKVPWKETMIELFSEKWEIILP